MRYPGAMADPRSNLTAATKRYRTTGAAHEEARQAAIAAVVAALRAGVGPTEVERLSPFTGCVHPQTRSGQRRPPGDARPEASRRHRQLTIRRRGRHSLT